MYRSDDEEIQTLLLSMRDEYRRDAEQELSSTGALSAKQSAYEFASALAGLLGLFVVVGLYQWASQLPLDHARSGRWMLLGISGYVLLAALWFAFFSLASSVSQWRMRRRLSRYLSPSDDSRLDLARLQQEPREALGLLRGSFRERSLFAVVISVICLHLLFGFIPFCPEHTMAGPISSLTLAFLCASLMSFAIVAEGRLALWLCGLLSVSIFVVGYVIARYFPSHVFPELEALYIINATFMIGVLLFLSWLSNTARNSWQLQKEPAEPLFIAGRCYLGD
jgi:hypothetical protein